MLSSKDSENLETSLYARDTYWMPCCLQAFRLLCIKNRHDSVMKITALAQEHLQKSLSVNTVHRAVHKCRLKLYHSKKKSYVNMIQKHCRPLWIKAHLKWTETKWNTCSVIRWLETWNHLLQTKVKRDHLACYQPSVQKPASLMVWGALVHTELAI